MTYTVDHLDTKDFDDAVSFEKTENGSIVRVHITDVASLITEDHALFELASDRCSSLYTIKETYSMFAPVLSEGLFSLKQESERASLTFEFKLDEQNDIIDTDIYRSLIKVDKNCSYDEIDEKIKEKSAFWSELWDICSHHASIRRENGSLEIDRYEVKLDISDPNNIQLKAIRENTPASLLIQELAILTNHLAASYAKDNRLPCLFRNQPPYTVSKNLDENEKPNLKDINIQPARVSLNPEGHSALGLDCYLQISSPIRRFLDLVNQIIIMSHIGNQESTFSQDMLLEWARRGEEIHREFVQIERKLSDHWKIKYLEQHRSEQFDAQFIRTNRNGKGQIVLTLIQLMLEMPMESISEEEFFKVRLDRVDAKLNRVSVQRIAFEETENDDLNPDQD
jgi:exoribonuclease-2